MNRRALVTLALVVCCTPLAQADDKELAKMTGTWKVVAMETNGATSAPEQVTMLNLQLIIKGNAYEVKVGDMVVDKGSVKVDVTKNPKTVHVTSSMGPNSGKTIPAIYELKDDEFKVCYDLTGGAVPKEFKSKEGTMLLVLTYKKAK